MAEAIAVPVGANGPPAIPGSVERGKAPAVPTAPVIAPAANVQPEAPKVETPVVPDTPAAPAAAAAPIQELLQTESPTPSLNTLDLNTIQDETIRTYGEFIKTLGGDMDYDRALAKALDYGDVNLLDEAYIREKCGDKADQVIRLAKAIVERTNSMGQEAERSVYALAGSEVQWRASALAFDKNAPTHIKRVVATLLNSGDPAQIKDAAQTVLDFTRQGGLVSKPAQFNVPAAGGANMALSREQFNKERQSLDPNSRTYRQDYEALFERRRQGKALGI